MTTGTVILASASKTRARLLTGAGVAYDTEPAPIDEERIKRDLRARRMTPEDIAAALAREKACAVSSRHDSAIVIGADQVLEIDGDALDKPADPAAAAGQLRRLSGRAHDQISCICIARGGTPIWSHSARTTLHVRDLSEAFISCYVAEVGPALMNGPGAYQLEGLGAQLFSRLDGDFFTVLGLPLLPLLGFLRAEGVLLT